jgi:hypothetical protein
MRRTWVAVAVAAGMAAGCGSDGKEATIKGPIGADRDLPPEGSGGAGVGKNKAAVKPAAASGQKAMDH